ncbi:hypothetical protein ACUY2Y_11505, partial [Corynebacterium sp. 20_84]
EVDPDTGEITVTVPEGTDPQDAKVVVKDKDGDKVGDVDTKITAPEEPAEDKPSIDAGDKTVVVPADGSEKKLDDTVVNPTEGMTGEVIGNDGKPVDGAKAEVDPDTGEITVTVPEGTDPQDAKVVVKDKDGDKVGDVDTKITSPKPKQSSSSEREGCTDSLIGFGLPLLALIPLGIASQTAIPGLQNIQAQVGRQIQDANTALQNQLGIMDPRLAKAAADFDAQLKGAGANLNHVMGGLAVLAYGIAAITTIATKCGPGNTKTQTETGASSKGSSSKGSSSKGKDENSSSSPKSKGDKGSSGSEGKGGSGKGAEAEAPAEGKNA